MKTSNFLMKTVFASLAFTTALCAKAQTPASGFIVATTDAKTDLAGGITLKVYQKGDKQTPTQTLHVPDAYTQFTYNASGRLYTGYVYYEGASDKGMGKNKSGLRYYACRDGKLSLADTTLVRNFGNTGCFGPYSYAAEVASAAIMRVGNDGSKKEIVLDLSAYAIDGMDPAISNIVDLGNNRVAIVLNYENRDSVAVAFADYDMNVSGVAYSDRIGVSNGQWHSVRYPMSGTDDEGNAYIFSGASQNDGKVGALRINKGETTFAADYHFDILKASAGYRFRRAIHISGDKFLLDFYKEKKEYANPSPSGKLAIADMGDKTLTWVDGLPTMPTLSIGWGAASEGVYYLPVSKGGRRGGRPGANGHRPGEGHRPEGMTRHEGDRPEGAPYGGNPLYRVTPTIYAIDAATGKATPFMTFDNDEMPKSIVIL